ncbi:ABC transporter substrate-binding protein, partial [Nitratireductor aquimarinus]|uniref:ABC transporter substrate-binding protein n=2 Tax=Nitratireductor aquimarinus TaxID=889300 RepID=UPI0031BA6CD0
AQKRSGDRAFSLARLTRPLAVCAMLALAACQSSGVEDTLNVEDSKVASSAAGLETIGSGPVTIGMVTGLAGTARASERDYRDGAKLAAQQLGGDAVTLAIYNAQANASGTKTAVDALVERGAKIIIGPAQAGLLNAVPSGGNPPVVAFVTNGAQRKNGVFAFLSDAVDSSIEAAAYAIGAGRKKIVIVHAADADQASLARLRSGISAKGGTVIADIPVSANSTGELASRAAQLQGAEAIVLAPGLRSPAATLAGLRATGALPASALILATPDFPPGPAGAGVLMCRVDQLAVGEITERFRTEFGRAMSRDAAYGFDAAALAIGIARARGAAGLTSGTLTSRSGFRGVLGSFRFSSSGAVERNCSIYRVEGNAFKMHDPAPNGF